MKNLVLSIFLFFTATLFSPTYAQNNQAKGTVYLDANENGTREPGEKGIEGVKVSNGYYVFHFEGNKVKSQFIPTRGDSKDLLRIMLDP